MLYPARRLTALCTRCDPADWWQSHTAVHHNSFHYPHWHTPVPHPVKDQAKSASQSCGCLPFSPLWYPWFPLQSSSFHISQRNRAALPPAPSASYPQRGAEFRHPPWSSLDTWIKMPFPYPFPAFPSACPWFHRYVHTHYPRFHIHLKAWVPSFHRCPSRPVCYPRYLPSVPSDQ